MSLWSYYTITITIVHVLNITKSDHICEQNLYILIDNHPALCTIAVVLIQPLFFVICHPKSTSSDLDAMAKQYKTNDMSRLRPRSSQGNTDSTLGSSSQMHYPVAVSPILRSIYDDSLVLPLANGT